MDDEEPVHLSEGINIRQLMQGKPAEFSINLDFKKKKEITLNFSDDDDDNYNGNDSGGEDALKVIEKSTDNMMLSSPEYHSFEQLASKMKDCDLNGNVKLLIIEEGDGPLVPPNAEVLIHHAAYYERSDIPFDTTLTTNRGEPLQIRMGVGKMIPGIEIGLTHVKGPKARFHLLLQPAAAWGQQGVLPLIQRKPVLLTITLYDVRCVGAGSRFNDLPKAEQEKFETTVKTVKDIREEGKDLFKRHKYQQAIKNYQQALSVLSQSRPENEKEENEIKDLKVAMYVNLAICYYKINKPKYMIGMCKHIDRCIDIDKHCKGIFYYGRAYELLGKTDEAISCYKKALKIEPKNKEIGQCLAYLDDKIKKAAVNEKVMWRKAIGNVPEVEKKTVYNVDDEFINGVADMCQDLAGRSEYAKFDLPMGLSRDEIICIKDLTSQFKCLVVLEDGEGTRKKVSVVKKM